MALSTITTALYACACCTSARRRACTTPLLVGLALEDRERGALGIAKDSDLAGGEIQGPGQHGTSKPAGLLHGGVARRNREVREPVRRRLAVLLRHRHETWARRGSCRPALLNFDLAQVRCNERLFTRLARVAALSGFRLWRRWWIFGVTGQQVEWMSAPTFSVSRNSS